MHHAAFRCLLRFEWKPDAYIRRVKQRSSCQEKCAGSRFFNGKNLKQNKRYVTHTCHPRTTHHIQVKNTLPLQIYNTAYCEVPLKTIFLLLTSRDDYGS